MKQAVCKVRIHLAPIIVKDHHHSHLEFPQHFPMDCLHHTTALEMVETHVIIIFIQSLCYV